jgi:hypothetical protein
MADAPTALEMAPAARPRIPDLIGGPAVALEQVALVVCTLRVHSTFIAVAKILGAALSTQPMPCLMCPVAVIGGSFWSGQQPCAVPDLGIFLPDEDLQRMADTLGVPYRRVTYRSFADLDDSYPDALRYRWQRRPTLFGLRLALVTFLLILASSVLISLL